MIQPYDIAMLVVLAAATVYGIWRGMVWQIASLASVLVSAAVAVHSSAAVAPYFPGEEPWNRYLAMLVLYMVTAGAIWIVFHLVSNVIDRIKLKEFDRQLGGTLGLAKGILYCIVITFFAVTLNEQTRQLVLVSRSGGLIATGIRNANPILPEDIRTHLGKYIDELNAKLSEPPATPDPNARPALPSQTAPPSALPQDAAPKTPAADPASENKTENKGVGNRLRKLIKGDK